MARCLKHKNAGEALCEECFQEDTAIVAKAAGVPALKERIAQLEKDLVIARAMLCSHATGAHDEECDLVSGFKAENATLRAFVERVKANAAAPGAFENAEMRLCTLSGEALHLLVELDHG